MTEEAMVAAVARWRGDLTLVWRELAADFASVTGASFRATKTVHGTRGRRETTTTETWPVLAGRRRERVVGLSSFVAGRP